MINITLSTEQYEILSECANRDIMSRFLKDEYLGFPDSILYMPNKFKALEDARAINIGLFDEMYDSMTRNDKRYYDQWRANESGYGSDFNDGYDKEVAND